MRVIKASESKVAFQASTDAPVGALCVFSKSGAGIDQVSQSGSRLQEYHFGLDPTHHTAILHEENYVPHFPRKPQP